MLSAQMPDACMKKSLCQMLRWDLTAQGNSVGFAGVLKGEAAGQRLFEVLAAVSPTLTAAGQEDEVQSWCGSLEV